MGIAEKTFDYFISTFNVSKKISHIITNQNRLDRNLQALDKRVIRLETLAEILIQTPNLINKKDL